MKPQTFEFRAYDKKWHRWILPNDFSYSGAFGWEFDRRETADGDIIETVQYSSNEVDLQQASGLKDDDGIDIYEGDILKIITANRSLEAVPVDKDRGVFFVEGLPLYGFFGLGRGSVVKIIGNIYDNQYLLVRKG